jgi:hypothetical protein
MRRKAKSKTTIKLLSKNRKIKQRSRKLFLNQLPNLALAKTIIISSNYQSRVANLPKGLHLIILRRLFVRFFSFLTQFFGSKKSLISYFSRLSYKKNKSYRPSVKKPLGFNSQVTHSLVGINSVESDYNLSVRKVLGKLQTGPTTQQTNTSPIVTSFLFKKYSTQLLPKLTPSSDTMSRSFRVLRKKRFKRGRRLRLPRHLHFVKPHNLKLKNFRASSTFFYLFRKISLIKRVHTFKKNRSSRDGRNRITRKLKIKTSLTRFHRIKKSLLTFYSNTLKPSKIMIYNNKPLLDVVDDDRT